MDDKNTNTAPRQRSKAINLAALRAVVAGYLVYLGGSLIYDYMKGRTDMAPIYAWGLGLLFIAAGLAYGAYTWKNWQRENADPPQDGGAPDA